MKKSIVSALILAALLGLSAFAATAQPGRMHGGPGGGPMMNIDRLADYLSLTAAQKAQVQQLHEKLKQTVEPLFEEHRRLADEVRAALDANEDAATVGAAVIAAHEQGKKIRAAHDQFSTDVEAILTPAQLSRWRALQDARKMMHPPIPGVDGPGHDD
jgi:Spy/CpxP family protein refolding chaperone